MSQPMRAASVPAGRLPEVPRTGRVRVARRLQLEGGISSDGRGEAGPELVLLDLASRYLARTVRPGQFVRIGLSGRVQPFHVATRWEGGVGILVRQGWGISSDLAALDPGARLEVTGPLGRPFAPVDGRPVWHVAAPGRLHALLLASSEPRAGAARAALAEVGRPQAPSWWRPGEKIDGTRGPGAAAEWLPLEDLQHLEARLAALPPSDRPALRAVGPMSFLAEVAAVARRRGVPLQVTVEQAMPCSIGVCLGCVVPRRGGEGAARWIRACREGPVFDEDELDWDLLTAGVRRSAPHPRWEGHPIRRRRDQPAREGPPAGMPDGPLQVKLGPTWLRNPLMPASGCFGYGREMAAFYPLRLLGAVVTKGVSLAPWEGRPTPRVAWTAGGILNAIGLQNPGVEHFLREDLPFLVGQGAAVVVNVVGESVDAYAAVAARLESAPRFPASAAPGSVGSPRPYTPGHGGLVALELNISCPNVDAGGLQFGQDPGAAAAVVRAVRAVSSLAVWVKLSPQGPAVEVARAAVEAGAQVLSVANTLPALSLDPRSGRSRLAAGAGGLSGPPLKPVNLALVRRLHWELEVPLVGIGGIQSVEDALEYRHAGATAVAVGSAHFRDPYVLLKLRRDLRRRPEGWMVPGAERGSERGEEG